MKKKKILDLLKLTEVEKAYLIKILIQEVVKYDEAMTAMIKKKRKVVAPSK